MKQFFRYFFAVLILLAGLTVFAYPTLSQKYMEWKGQQAVSDIAQMREENAPRETVPVATETLPAVTEETVPATEPTEATQSELDLLLEEIVAYNERIYQEGQSNFRDPFSYEAAPIDLTQYGFEENVIATIWIPRLDVELPVYLGATWDNMAKGVAVLGETSLPARGENTNVVIAGHRGYWGTAMFRDIQLIQIDDKITITTPWDTLIYRVCELKIITPDETNAVLIQPGRQLLTLLTCHPYTQNYQRYLVFAELSDEEPEQDKKEDLAEAEKTFDDTPRTVVSSDGEGNVQEVQVEPVSIQPVANEGAQLESGAAYSNTMLLIEKYAPPVVIGLLVLLLLVRLLRRGRKDET